jgi:hypothetical protein
LSGKFVQSSKTHISKSISTIGRQVKQRRSFLPTLLTPAVAGHRSLVRQLLAYAAAPADRRDTLRHWRLTAADERQFRWLLEAGLGALLHHAVRERPERVPAAWRERLAGEEMTARLRHADRVDAACDVVDRCAQLREPLTLLKGIATSEEFYPAPHLRPMADIDVLASPGSCRRIQSVLVSAGYRSREDPVDDDEQHHVPPLRHPTLGVWIEVHRRLFRAGDALSNARVFSAESIEANTEWFTFRSRRTRRLQPEIQLIYLAASWMRDMQFGLHPSFLASLFDATFLLACATLDWDKLVALASDPIPRRSLYVLLSYLATRGLGCVPRDVRRAVAGRRNLAAAFHLGVTHAVLDRYLVGGRAWSHAFPPRVPDRYRVGRQWSQRVPGRPYREGR